MSIERIRVQVAGRTAILSGTELVVGRSPYCTLVLDHSSVSRVHASLRRIDERIYLTDLGSRNGTYVNGQRLEPNRPAMVRPGDHIGIGHQVLTLDEVAEQQFQDTGTRENPLFDAIDGEETTTVSDISLTRKPRE
jgi:adenylate cyclase